jgi:hypothetical protein
MMLAKLIPFPFWLKEGAAMIVPAQVVGAQKTTPESMVL